MPTYHLKPIDRTSLHWKRSWHRGECLVAAASETEAREFVAAMFDQVARREPSEKSGQATDKPLVTPWTNPDLVSCAETEMMAEKMKAGMVALPDGKGGWQLRGGPGGGADTVA
jgi:hypothetical protein